MDVPILGTQVSIYLPIIRVSVASPLAIADYHRLNRPTLRVKPQTTDLSPAWNSRVSGGKDKVTTPSAVTHSLTMQTNAPLAPPPSCRPPQRLLLRPHTDTVRLRRRLTGLLGLQCHCRHLQSLQSIVSSSEDLARQPGQR